MMIRLIVLALAAAAVLAFVWFRNRRIVHRQAIVADEPDRGLIGEIATAYEDMGRQVLNESGHLRLRPDGATGVGEKD